jgi:hypothetical protein
LAAAAVLTLVAASGCSDDSTLASTKVFKGPPWQAAERFTYDLRDQGNKLNGTCELKTTPNKEPGKTLLEHLCGNPDGDRDDRNVTVDAQTLTPFGGSRAIVDAGKKTTTTFTSTYNPPKVNFKADENGNVHNTERDLPAPTKDSPDPGYYDDESLFWVIRGVPLEKGWQGAYSDVNASNGQIFMATITVENTESVTVPAGKFNAWKIRLETNSVTQFFWVDTAAPHAVVQAAIESITYKLTAAS